MQIVCPPPRGRSARQRITQRLIQRASFKLAPVALACALVTVRALAAETEPGFESLFDGHSLAGWETPDPGYWSVEEGAITGRITKERPCTTNQYLVWKGGELADFELKLESRLNGEGAINNGFQFRSRVLPDHDLCGYQVDNNLRTDWLVRLYDEYGRHTLAMRGERAVFDPHGVRTATPVPGGAGAAAFRLEDWHEYHLTCVGPRLTLRVNGQLVAEVEDRDPRRQELQGVLALQLHSGPPTVVQFKNIRLKILKPADRSSSIASTAHAKRSALFREVLAHWPLDAGGHGASPPLRLVPQFYQFEMNVRAAGPGARPEAKVTLLDGAYFDAETQLHAPADRLTVYLRARDPKGNWNAALMSKRGAANRVHFRLFAADLPETSGPDIAFQIQTAQGIATVSFAVAQIAATAWHDLVGRFDGTELTVFCDGKLMAAVPAAGTLLHRSEPLLIGAEIESGQPVRHFRGEVEEAALWGRALTDVEIAELSRPSPARRQ